MHLKFCLFWQYCILYCMLYDPKALYITIFIAVIVLVVVMVLWWW